MKIYTIETADNAMAPSHLVGVVSDYAKATAAAKVLAERGLTKLTRSVFNPETKTTVFMNEATKAYGRVVEWEV